MVEEAISTVTEMLGNNRERGGEVVRELIQALDLTAWVEAEGDPKDCLDALRALVEGQLGQLAEADHGGGCRVVAGTGRRAVGARERAAA